MNFNIVKIAKAEHNRSMEPIHLGSEEHVRAAFRQGEDAVIALLNETLGKLAESIQILEDQIAKNSSNSSKPPSSDGEKRRRGVCVNPVARKAVDNLVIKGIR